MDLWLVRHAPAEPMLPAGGDDERALTKGGRLRFEAAVRALVRLEVDFERLASSPKRRALETAALLTPLARSPAVRLDALGAPPGPALFAALADEPDTAVTCWVGHEPWLSELAVALCFGTGARSAGLAVAKGAFLHLRGNARPGGMELVDLWRARALEALVEG